ncbi:hypothetical protein DUNSADRAFT_13220 [Dunaliella salina]|uniref:Encoded protein n=1 Tax=Dunaliella salina TaxID=3046 RepID=A0ABQ7H3A8_DUNSA|nr:hypothetical protein DUNSADRAFT_13220 [Dunaliella salina]|eukprot:KAF5841352.1 hypothetical protein DUNSADRAFT_13220 [Dunaliella salina]
MLTVAATSASSSNLSDTAYPSAANPVPLASPAARRAIIISHSHGGDHHLPHHQVNTETEIEFGLVAVLVVVHVAALCFWMWLLYSPARSSKSEDGMGRRGSEQWRTPREIIAQYTRASEKARLGKV